MTPPPGQHQVSFRRMGRDDLPQLRVWLREPHVAQWWPDADETIAAVAADGTEGGVEPWAMELDGLPVGFIQWYRVEDEDPETWFPGVEVPPGTVGVDLAIGDPELVGRGHGRRLLLEFAHHVIRSRMPECPEVWIDPDPDNERAIRAYRAAGFADTGIDLPDPQRPGERRRLLRMRFPGPTFH